MTDVDRWLQSRKRARTRRIGEARAKLRSRLRRRGASAMIVALALAGGAASAHDQRSARVTAAPTATVGLLKMGSGGPAVAALQRALGIEADGYFGPATRSAVRRFQRRAGLVVDGIVGPATLQALKGGVTRARTSRPRVLARIATCESGGNPRALSADGRYRGKYQFTRATWRALGGSGDPSTASETEQDSRAAVLLAREGTKPWPTCA